MATTTTCQVLVAKTHLLFLAVQAHRFFLLRPVGSGGPRNAHRCARTPTGGGRAGGEQDGGVGGGSGSPVLPALQ